MFLDLCRLAQTTGHTTDELLQLYVLEGFLDRLQTVITFVDTLPT